MARILSPQLSRGEPADIPRCSALPPPSPRVRVRAPTPLGARLAREPHAIQLRGGAGEALVVADTPLSRLATGRGTRIPGEAPRPRRPETGGGDLLPSSLIGGRGMRSSFPHRVTVGGPTSRPLRTLAGEAASDRRAQLTARLCRPARPLLLPRPGPGRRGATREEP